MSSDFFDAARLLLVALLVGAAPLRAQPRGDAQQSADMPSLIASLGGQWTLDVTMSGATDPVTGHGEETWRGGPGGLTMLEEEHLALPGHDLYLLGIVWRDKGTNEFHGMQCNNNDPHVCDVKGSLNDIAITWDGRQLVIEEQEVLPGGRKQTYRETYSEVTPTSFTQTGDVRAPGGTFQRVMTIHAKRPSTR